jgi:Mg-chelatase subunit ChlD
MLKANAWIAVVLIGIGCPAAACAQGGGQHLLNAGPAYTSQDGDNGPQFPRVDMVVRFTGADGLPQPVQAEDLSLVSGDTELGRGSSMRTFAETGYGIKAILALDASGSMNGAPLRAIHASIAKFVNQARDQDRVEVLTFADDTRVEVPFGADKAALGEHLRSVKSRGTQTRLYDGLLEALARFDGDPPVRRSLTVISDGHDEGSQHTIDDVIRQARSDGVSIDCIGLARNHLEYLQSLANISQATGGNYRRANSPEELEGLIDQGIRSMRATPVVAFHTSKLASDGRIHVAELRWRPEQLAATVEIRTPLIKHSWFVWGWVLAACFLAGVILLVVSWRLSRRALVRTPIPEQPAAAPLASSHSGAPRPEQDKPFRAETTSAAQAYPTPPAELPREPSAQAAERGKTRLAVFFDPARNGHAVMLKAIRGPVAGSAFPVTGEVRIGAEQGNHVVVPGDPTLSGFHARVLLANAVLTIEDCQSTNGSFVNGVRLGLGRKLLRPGDEIRLGRSIFLVKSG